MKIGRKRGGSQSSSPFRRGKSGMLMAELYVTMAIFTLLVLAVGIPLSLHQQMVRRAVHRAVATEIVDGEIEVLAAGAWRGYEQGERDFVVSGAAARSLPKGRFVITVNERLIRLDWRETLGDSREVIRVRRELGRSR